MENEHKDKLIAEFLNITDSKWVLGHWYVKIILNGRAIPDFTSMAGMAQDELGHTRAMFDFLEQSLGLPENQIEFGRKSEEVHNMELLDEAPQSWTDYVLSVYLAEHALWHEMEAYIDGKNQAISNLFTKFVEEGYFHRLYIDGWITSLSEEEMEEASKVLSRRLPIIHAWFTQDGDNSLVAAGFKTKTAEEIAQNFNQSVEELCKQLNLPVPEVKTFEGDWDAYRRRPAGSKMPAKLWEYILPTSEEAKMARRPLEQSLEDNIDLFVKKTKPDNTLPFFENQ